IFGFRSSILLVLVLAGLAAGGYTAWSWWSSAQLLSQGERALAQREYTKAHDLFARYLNRRPGDTRAQPLAGRAARRLKQYDEAEDHLRRCRQDKGLGEAVAVEYALLDVQRGGEGSLEALRQRALVDDELALLILEVLIQQDLDTYRL